MDNSDAFAATFQTIRFTLQKILKAMGISPLGATYSRFIFAAPLISLFSLVFLATTDISIPYLEGSPLVICCGWGACTDTGYCLCYTSI